MLKKVMQKTVCFKSKFGFITLVEQNKKIVLINFIKSQNKGKSIYLNKLKKNINKFFYKKNKKINANILLIGTKIQIKIWNEIKKIPYGKTKSYGEIAKSAKTSPRYVGNVCGKNKILIIIPCHRVIRSDGSLGGFSGTGGLQLKQRLLDFEQKN